MKKILLFGLAIGLIAASCKDDPSDNVPNQTRSFSFQGQTHPLDTLIVFNYDEREDLDGQYNLDFHLFDGHLDTSTYEFIGTSQYLYFEVSTSTTNHIKPGTYYFDADWGANTFDDAYSFIVRGTDTIYYSASSGSLHVNSYNQGLYDLSFELNMFNEGDSSDTGILKGTYQGNGLFLEFAPTLFERASK